MDYRERLNDHQETMRLIMLGRQRNMWTALPGIIETVDLTKLICTVQPAIKVLVFDQDDNGQHVQLPILPDVPLVFPRGGGYTLTFPVKPGDECLVILSARAIDNWWQAGGVQPAFDSRMHSLSDGFALVGPFSQPQRPQAQVSTTAPRLTSDDGSVFVEVNDSIGQVTVKTPTQVVLDSPRVVITGQLVVQNAHGASDAGVITGELNVSGNVISGATMIAAGDVTSAAVSLRHHVHSNSGGTGNSGPPVGG